MQGSVRIVGFEDYIITCCGKVFRDGKELRQHDDGRGYLFVWLRKDGKCFKRKIHRLVAGHFIPNPQANPIVDHRDGNKHNNNFRNLEWVTHRENIARCDVLNGGRTLSPVAKIGKNGKPIDVYISILKAACCVGADYRTLYNAVKQGRKYKGYFWRLCSIEIGG